MLQRRLFINGRQLFTLAKGVGDFTARSTDDGTSPADRVAGSWKWSESANADEITAHHDLANLIPDSHMFQYE